jgi:L-threonylcarbamoyladenylate synthase
LLASTIQIVKKYSKPIELKDEVFLKNNWPGPVTFLIKYKESIPDHLKNSTGKLAFRVSNHYPLKVLFKRFNGVMVSTSANISGKQTLNSGPEIIKTFANNNHLAYYDQELGKETKPTTIIDLHTREIIRP